MKRDDSWVQPVNVIIGELLKMPVTHRVVSLFQDNTLKVWLVTEQDDIKTKRQCCNLFAEMVDKYLPSDCLFDLRIVTPDSVELKDVPQEATVNVRE